MTHVGTVTAALALPVHGEAKLKLTGGQFAAAGVVSDDELAPYAGW